MTGVAASTLFDRKEHCIAINDIRVSDGSKRWPIG